MAKTGLGDSYSLARIRSVPFPTRLLELTLTLPETQARIVLFIVRASLGWTAGPGGLRKASARVTYRRLREKVGRSSSLALTQALEALVKAGIVEALTMRGDVVPSTPRMVYRRQLLRLRIARHLVEETGDNSVDSFPKPRPFRHDRCAEM